MLLRINILSQACSQFTIFISSLCPEVQGRWKFKNQAN